MSHGFGTKAIHTGQDPSQWDMNQVVPVISLATTYVQPSPGQCKGYDYTRTGNPTRDVLQKNLAALEDAKHCYVFSSGLAAANSIINRLKAGDHIVVSDDVYGGVQEQLLHVAAPNHGIEVSFVDLTKNENIPASFKSNTKMIWFESPSNPLLKVVDIKAVVDAARKANPEILVVADNTFMSPYFQSPFTFGVDIVMHSLTKYINGHTDVLMGAVMTNREDISKHLEFQQVAIGAVPSSFDCYLVHRGIKTLHVRMRVHYENALAVAKFLEGNERIERVFYPALPSHPQHETHMKQSRGMSGMISFYVNGGQEETERFAKELKVYLLAVSLGGYESLVALPTSMIPTAFSPEERAALGITPNLVRMSVGLEDKEDLIADLDQALKKAIPSV